MDGVSGSLHRPYGAEEEADIPNFKELMGMVQNVFWLLKEPNKYLENSVLVQEGVLHEIKG